MMGMLPWFSAAPSWDPSGCNSQLHLLRAAVNSTIIHYHDSLAACQAMPCKSSADVDTAKQAKLNEAYQALRAMHD